MEYQDDPWLAGEAYDRFMGRWSRVLADAFLRWLNPAPGLRWLDVGCGTGALSQAILRRANPESVFGVDPSAGFIRVAEAGDSDPRLTFRVAGVENLLAPSDSFDAAVSGLALNFFPDPVSALQVLSRCVVPGGLVAATVWDYAGQMQFLRYFWDTAISLDPNARSLDQGVRFLICNPDRLERLFLEAGFGEVRVEMLTIHTPFSGFADYWDPFLAATGTAPAYVASLDGDHRQRLEAEVRARLKPGNDGIIRLTAGAWAVRGTAR